MSTQPPGPNNHREDHPQPTARSGWDDVWDDALAVLSEGLEVLRDVIVLVLRVLIISATFVVAVYYVVTMLAAAGAWNVLAHPASSHTTDGTSSYTGGAVAGHTDAGRPATGRTVTAAVTPAALHTPLANPGRVSGHRDPASSANATNPTAVQPVAGRVGCRTERGHGGDRAVIGAGPVQISIDTDVADCADNHRARSRSRTDNDDGDDRNCRCDRGRNRSSSRDRDPVIYLPADPSSYPRRSYPREAYPGGYYPREGYSPGYRAGDRPGHVCRQVRPGEHPDLPDGGLICIPADRAPAGW